MTTLKEEAIEAISKLPASAEVEDMMYRLYVIDKIHKGKESIKNGKSVSIEKLEKEIESW